MTSRDLCRVASGIQQRGDTPTQLIAEEAVNRIVIPSLSSYLSLFIDPINGLNMLFLVG